MGSKPHSIELAELLEHAGWLTALARRLVADSGVAEDLVQETWLAALRNPPADRRNLRGWLASVARNAARSHHRREGVGPRAELQPQAGSGPWTDAGPAELAQELEAQRMLVGEVLALAEPYRSTVILRYWHGLDAGAIARREGLAAGTVRWRLKQGLDRLRSRLDDRHEGDRRGWCLALAPLARRPLATPQAGPGAGPDAGVGPSTAAGRAAEGAARSVGGAPSVVSLVQGLLGLHLLAALGVAVLVTALVLVVRDRSSSGRPELEGPTAMLGAEDVPSARPAASALRVEGGGRSAAPPAGPAATERTGVAASTASSLPPGADPARLPSERVEQVVELRAVDREGRPVRSARIVGTVVGDPQLEADGRLVTVLQTLRGSLDLSFSVAAPGYATERLEVQPSPGTTLHLGEVVLGPGGDLNGRVFDGTGEPIAGAWVEADAARMREAQLEAERLTRSGGFDRGGLTDSDGRFELAGVPAGRLRVWAGREGLMASATDELVLEGGGVLEGLELVLEPYPTERVIAGRVEDGKGRGVRASLRFEYRSLFGSGSHQTHTGDDGRFAVFCEHPRKARTLRVTPYGDELGSVLVEGVRVGTLDLVIELPPARPLVIEVRGPEGLLANPELQLRDARDGQLATVGGGFRAEEVAEGNWTTRAPGEPFTVLASAPGHREQRFGPFSPGALPEVIVCELEPQPVVRGRAVDGEGAPLPRAEVRVVGEATERTIIDGFLVRVALSAADEVVADGEGRFEGTVRERGRYYVQVTAEGLAMTELGPLAVDPARGLELGDVRLTEGGTLEGRVELADGAATGSIVGVSRGDGRARTARVGPDGGFRLDHLTPGPWQVELVEQEITRVGGSGSSFSWLRGEPIPFTHEVREGETTRVRLGPGEGPRVLLGRVSIDGEPASGLEVQGQLGEGFAVFAEGELPVTDAEGRFELRFPRAGTVQLMLSGPHAFGLVARIELVEPRTEWSLELELARLEVHGLDRIAGFEGLPAALFLWERDGVVATASLEVDPDGGPVAVEVPAGPGRLVAVGPELMLVSSVDDLLAQPVLARFETPTGGIARVELP